LDSSYQRGCQLGLSLPAWTPAWTIVPAWIEESYISIPPHLHSKSLPIFLRTFGRVALPDLHYKRRACSPKAGSEEREGATQLSRTVVPWVTVHSLHLVTVQPGPYPTVSWASLSLSSPCYFSCVVLVSCCQYLVLDVIPLFNVDCHMLHSCRVAGGLFP
jgi:hypothetical protein